MAAGTSVADLAKMSLPQAQKPAEEFLLYRLSFSGFLTAFLWKDIADTVITADNNPYKFNKKKACRLDLRMSTEDFLISELFSPMRYHWRVTLDPDLNRLFAIEKINKNEDDIHDVVQIKQKKKKIDFYHKRKKIALASNDDDFFSDEQDDFYEDEEKIMVWEKVGKKKAPASLIKSLGINPAPDYLVYDGTIKMGSDSTVFDPLSLIYSARWYDYNVVRKVDFTVVYKTSFRKYQLHYVGKETLDIADKTFNVIKVEIKGDENDASSGEGWMAIWLSDDERRIPLKYLIEIKSGTLKLNINATNLENYQIPTDCVDRKRITSMKPVTGRKGSVSH